MENPPFTTIGDEPVEARIVAWVLGETSAFEAAELERLCEERPELLVFKRRMLALHDLLTEAETSRPDVGWKLPPEKRKALEQIIGEEKPVRLEVEKRIRHSGRRAFLAIAACLALSLVVFSLLPGKYEAAATIEVKPRTTGMSPLAESTAPNAITPQFLGTEMDRINSRSSLKKVVENLGLDTRWGTDKETALRRLRDNVSTRQIRGTDLLEIRAREKDPELAKSIANEVTRAYKESRTEAEQRVAEQQLAELNKSVRDQEDKVEERRKVLATLVRTKGIIYKGNDSFYGKSGGDEDQGAKSALQAYHQMEAEKQQKEAQISSLLKYDGEQLMTYASGLDLPDNIVRETYPEYLEEKRKLEALKASGVSEEDPSAKALAANVEEKKRQLDEGVVNLRATLGAQLDLASTRLASMEEMKNETREEAIKRGLDAQDYVDAKREFESDQALLQQMKLKQMGESIAARIPRESVLVHEEAATAAPANPLRAAASKLKGVFSNKETAVAASESPRKAKPMSEADVMALDAPQSASHSAARQPGGRDLSVETEVSAGNAVARRESNIVAGVSTVVAAAPPVAESVPVPAVDMDTPSLAFGDADDHGAGWGGPVDAPAGGAVSSRSRLSKREREMPVLKDRLLVEGAKSSRDNKPEAEPRTKDADAKEKELAAAPADPFWDTSEVATSGKVSGGTEYQLHTGSRPEYLFRGMKLDKNKQPTPTTSPSEPTDEIPAAQDPYSTFSLNISDASFQVAQAALAKGEQPDPAGIKVEQFYNAVDYGDPAPGAGEPVAVNIEQAAHPVIPGRILVRVALKTAAAGRSAAQPLRLTMLVDQSGSMARDDRRIAMDKALGGLAGLLTKDDLVSVIGFSRTPRLLADGMTGEQAGKLTDLVNQAASEGGTNLEEAMKLGGRLAQRNKLAGAQNRIVLLTDGAANLGDADPARLAENVKQLRQQGIALDIAGIAADGLNDGLLGELARNGNGRYQVVGKGAEEDFAKQLAGAFRPAAENVKVQVRFNPERVARYKLIGFEKDRLKTEDFRNDKVDAAELAAEEAGVAIYQVEPLPEGDSEIGEVSVRFRDTASSQMVERSWTIPHDAAAPAIDRAAPSMQLAVLSMLAAEKLKGGPLAAAIDFKQLSALAANVKQFYGDTGRVGEVLRMVDALK